MSLLKDLFQSKRVDKEMTSLNLETPKPQSPTGNSTSGIPIQIDPKVLEVARPEVKRRAKELLEAGQRPEALYLAVTGTNNLISFRTTNPDHNILLVFTSGFAAIDYLRTAKIAGGVHMFPFESLSAYLEMWKKAQLDSFVLDRCPRCPHFILSPVDGCTEEKFLLFWAIHRATRNSQSERLIRAYLTSSKNASGTPSNSREIRIYLETLRDHVDYNIPFLHWLIAIHAGVEGDQEARTASIQNLEAFGPDFVGKVPPNEPFVLETWSKSVVDAQIGLLAAFEMLPPDPPSTVKTGQEIIN